MKYSNENDDNDNNDNNNNNNNNNDNDSNNIYGNDNTYAYDYTIPSCPNPSFNIQFSDPDRAS